LIIAILLLLANVILANSFIMEKPLSSNETEFHTFSVLISAKNEEENIPILIKSLQSLDYPEEYFEIIIVDDNSSDKTNELLRKFKKSTSNLTVIKSGNKTLPGKKGALQKALPLCRSEFIASTDADCVIPPNWLRGLNSKINEGADIVIGNVLFTGGDKFPKKFFSFEQMRNRFLSFALANIGFPYTASGGNFCFKKEIIDKLNGYVEISDTLSGDDDLLLQKGVSAGFAQSVSDEKETRVLTKPPDNFKQFFKQKQRHASASNYYSLKAKLILGFWHLINLTAILGLFLSPFFRFAFALFIVKITCDSIAISYAATKYEKSFNIFEIVFYQLLYELLIPVHYLRATFGSVKWK